MALTAQQLQQARDWLNSQYGGSRDASGTFQPGAWNFNPNDSGTNNAILGAAHAMGYGAGDVAQITGLDSGMIQNYQNSLSPSTLDTYSRTFQRDAGAGMYAPQQSDSLFAPGAMPPGGLHADNMGPFPSGHPSAGGGITNDQINQWLASNPGATDSQIRSAMNQYGVGVDQMSRATGLDYNTVMGRYQAAGPQGNTRAPGGGPTPATDPSLIPNADPRYGMDDFGMGGGSGSPWSNPWMTPVANDMGRRTMQGLGQGFNMIRSNSAGVGGLGGSRQGVAEGMAMQGAFDSLQGNLANLYGADWTGQQNRNLTRYGMDQNYSLGMGGLENQRYGMDQNFYTSQRGQDLQQVGLGAQLYGLGQQGPWGSLNNAGSIYGGIGGGNTNVTIGGQGGGWQGALGGALGGAQLGKNLGWWGS